MYDFKLRYLASVYLDADSLVPNVELIEKISLALDDKRFTPHTIIEDLDDRKIPRIGFIIPDEGRQLILSGKRFDLSIHPTNITGNNIGEFSNFCQEAAIKLCALLNVFERKARRLAVVREGLLPKMDLNELNEIANKFLKLPKTYLDNSPYEWDWRSVSSFNREFSNRIENTNTIVVIKRVHGKMGVPDKEEMEFDRIRIDFDINTIQSNIVERFNISDVEGFFNKAPEWHSQLENEITDHIKR